MAKKKVESQLNTIGEIVIDTSDISDTLTERARRFVFWYCFPGSEAFWNKKRAAIRAGYAIRNAAVSGYKLCKNPDVINEVERLSKTFSSETVDSLYRKYIATLEQRAFYDPADFVKGKAFKPIEEIPAEKRIALDQPVISRKGEVMGYMFGSRKAALEEIKQLHAKERLEDSESALEETREIIMERISIREKKRNMPDYKALEAVIVDHPPGRGDEEM
jgi:hypothetical protein